jgi:hypothetical protein
MIGLTTFLTKKCCQALQRVNTTLKITKGLTYTFLCRIAGADNLPTRVFTNSEFLIRDYIRPENVDHFSQYLQYFMRNWPGQNWYSPYVALCQSSGYGKSKLLIELGRKGFFHVFYVSFDKDKSAIVTPATPHVQDLCTNPSFSTVERFEAFLCGCVNVALKQKYTAMDLINLVGSESASQFWSDVMTATNRAQGNLTAQFHADCNKLRRLGSSAGVLFIFDVASELLVREVKSAAFPSDFYKSPFHLLQRALCNLALWASHGIKFFAVLADTSLRISRFAPRYVHDPSSRAVIGDQLCPPCFIMETLGQVTTTTRRRGNVMRVSHAGNEYVSRFTQLVSLCRPVFVVMWETLSVGRRAQEAWQQIRRAAISKLLNVAAINSISLGTVGTTGAIAMLACRINFIPAKCDKDELVASHMGTLMSLSDDTEDLFVEYVAEPVLGEAACFCWRIKAFLERVIRLFCKAVQAGAFRENVDELGIAVATIYLCRLFDRCAQRSCSYSIGELSSPGDSVGRERVYGSLTTDTVSDADFCASDSTITSFDVPNCYEIGLCCHLIPLRQFLGSLLMVSASPVPCEYGGTDQTLQDNCGSLLDGVICLSQFVSGGESISREILVEAAQRRVGLKWGRNDRDVDIVIPVVFSSNGSDINMNTLGPANIGAILIQVKNYRQKVFSPDAVRALATKIGLYAEGFGADFPYVGIIMAMGPSSVVDKTKGSSASMLVQNNLGCNPVYAVDSLYEGGAGMFSDDILNHLKSAASCYPKFAADAYFHHSQYRPTEIVEAGRICRPFAETSPCAVNNLPLPSARR